MKQLFYFFRLFFFSQSRRCNLLIDSLKDMGYLSEECFIIKRKGNDLLINDILQSPNVLKVFNKFMPYDAVVIKRYDRLIDGNSAPSKFLEISVSYQDSGEGDFSHQFDPSCKYSGKSVEPNLS
ncbi:hypothetical protein [Olivibacter domesticus]|uniref:Uncharacterized protein n=1 Tax=Olivibacter domesticus TaxID=407022 RepID=A0A1H7IL92_OLID1|nr:hypothetical protein [Olivibacter domesticus]SEK62330.1 hypothetical protein SAMN05661044_00718 [Olivibacter domesticus]